MIIKFHRRSLVHKYPPPGQGGGAGGNLNPHLPPMYSFAKTMSQRPSPLATQSRPLSPNELYARLIFALPLSRTSLLSLFDSVRSYFLQSREYGMNDAFRECREQSPASHVAHPIDRRTPRFFPDTCNKLVQLKNSFLIDAFNCVLPPVNNVFLAPRGLLRADRLKLVWAIICIRHPIMAARVDMKVGDYDSARFV